jgi:hypothetical protein
MVTRKCRDVAPWWFLPPGRFLLAETIMRSTNPCETPESGVLRASDMKWRLVLRGAGKIRAGIPA